MRTPSIRTADRFRAAVHAGRFSDANELLVTMRREVEVEWRAAGSSEQRERIANETTTLLRWARAAILASRAHTQSRLAALKRENAYTIRPPRHPQLDLEV